MATTASPVIKVGIAIPPETLGDNYDPAPNSGWWYDVTSRVRKINTIDGGRQRDLDTIEAGTATLVLDNSDRYFEPGNPSGIIAEGGNGTGGGFNQHVRIVAGYYAEMVNNDNLSVPSAWFRLDDRGRVVICKNEFGHNTDVGRDGTYAGTPDLGGKGFLKGKTTFNADGVDDYADIQQLGGETWLDLVDGFALGIAIAPDTLPGAGTPAGLIVRATAGDANPGQVNLLLTNAGEIQYLSGTGATVTTSGAGITAGGGPYVIVVNFDNGLSPKCKIYVNGVLRGSGNPDNPVVSSVKHLLIGRRGTGGFFDGRMADAWIAGNGMNFEAGQIAKQAAEFLAGHADGYLFYGYADGWPQDYPANGFDAEVTLAATDAFKLFANVDLPSSVFAFQVELDYESAPPRAWWRLGEPEQSLTAFNSGAGVLGATGDEIATAAGGTPNWTSGLVANDDNGGVTLPAGVYLKTPSGTTIGGQQNGFYNFAGCQFIIDCLIQRTGNPSATQVIYQQDGNGTADGQTQVRCTLTTAGVLQLTVVTGGLLFTAATTLNVCDGLPHAVRFHRRCVTGPTGTIKIYVDGVERASTNMNNGGGLGGASFGIIGPFDGVLDELKIEDATIGLLIADEGLWDAPTAYNYMLTPWRGLSTTDAALRLLEWVGWATAKEDVGTGETLLDNFDLDDKLLTTLQRLADIEDSRMFMAPNGNFTFYGRDAYTQPGLVAGYGQGDVRSRFGNLVDNWSFETDLTGWTVDAPGGRDTGTGRHGTSSVWLVDDSAVANKKMSQVGEPITVRPGQALHVEAWVLPQAGATKATLLFRYSDGSADFLVQNVTPNYWQRITLDTVIASGKLTGHIEIYPTDATLVAPQGKMFVDAVWCCTLPYVDPLKIDWDEVNVYNIANVSRYGGTARTLKDTTSIAEHGPRSISKTDLMMQEEEEATDRGNWIVDQHGNAHRELRSLKLRPAETPDLWHEVLNRRFGDKVKVWHQPPATGFNAGEPILKTVRIEKISHAADVKADQWETTWQLSFADDDQPWLLGDAVYGVLDTTTKLGH